VPDARPNLTPHFAAREFDCHDGTRWPAGVRNQLQLLCVRFLEPLRRSYGPVTITSGFRHYDYNKSVGGARASYHVWTPDRRGVAVDLVAKRGTPKEWAQLLAHCGPCGLSVYDRHVHVDSRGSNVRW
jgi:uncharacterized protein YcbK (DUF882 family)